jgi:hypothetical protein
MPTAALVLLIVLLGLVIGVLGGAFLAPARVRLEVDDGVLVVRLGFWDKVLCLRGGVRLPLAQVRAVRAADRVEVPRPRLRLPGSAIPGVIIAGSYDLGANRTFWDVRRAQRLLLVQCHPGSAYAALVLEVPDPDATAAWLTGSALAA